LLQRCHAADLGGIARAGCIVNRVVSLDLLRGLAAWAVAIPHFFSYHAVEPDTFELVSIVAVEIFFVLSGYVLASQILFCMSEAQPKVFLIFLTRRWMRTIPPYIVALVIMSVLTRELGSADFFRYLGYVQNFFRQSNHNDYFSVAWSLSVEEWFYVVFPGLLIAGTAFTGRNNAYRAIASAAIFVAVIAVARLLFGDFGDWGAAVRRVVAFRVDAIAYGFLLYVAAERVFPEYFKKLPMIPLVIALVVSTVLVFWGTAAAGADQSLLAKHLFPWLAAIFGSFCIMVALKAERAIASRRWLAGLGVFGGRISYSVYLFHTIFLLGLGAVQGSQPVLLKFTAYVVFVGLFAAVFYATFERPILLVRPKLLGNAD
jgi:peptidoglycan/LPS O-acetylase OafA/YrhL